jgi:hypothetical protein
MELMGFYNNVSCSPGHYFLFDCPGQAELYTHHTSFFNIAQRLQKLNYRVRTALAFNKRCLSQCRWCSLCAILRFQAQVAAVHLVDSQHCTDAGKYIAAALMSLQTMVRLEMPHVNLLSKVDLLEGADGDLRKLASVSLLRSPDKMSLASDTCCVLKLQV